jgi:L-ascorbate metabolism protein UlaG (beta-lactamase superfamily)
MSPLSITWLGHATFLLQTPGNVRLLFDPWLQENPRCPEAWKRLRDIHVVLITHGHFDHLGDAVQVSRDAQPDVVANHEICRWLDARGVNRLHPMNTGGTVRLREIDITMVRADHSSSWEEDGRLIYMGQPGGFVLRLENGVVLYFAGDTALFGDMKLIAELHAPDIAFLPIGDRFTMGPQAAAKACELLGVRLAVPMHYGTFPLLTGTPAHFRALVEPLGVRVLELEPGETAE